MNKRKRFLVVSGSVAAAVVLALVAVWWFVLRSNAPPAVNLDDAVAAATSITTATGADPSVGIGGDWAVQAGNGSFAGYRVEEELARIGFTTAAGRTTGVEASLVIEGDTVTSVEIRVDMQGLRSDSDRRDGAIRQQALETNQFPTASFSLVEPIVLPPQATAGSAFAATAIGDLEIHGVTNRVELALEAQLVDGLIVVIGSTEVLFADYAIDQPSALVLLSVDDHGLIEFQLFFARA